MSPAGKPRDHAAENANRSRLRLELRPTDEEREAIEALRAQLGGVTITGTLLGSADAVRVLLAGMVTTMAGGTDAWRLLPWVRQVAGLRRAASILGESFEAPVSARSDRYAVECGDMYAEVA